MITMTHRYDKLQCERQMTIQDLTDFGPKLRVYALVRIEDLIGAGLPSDYRLFLLLTNGAGPVEKHGWFKMKTKTNRRWSRLHFFYGIRCRDTETCLLEYAWRTYSSRIQPAMFPIAGDVYGNQILLLFKGKEAGKVSFWSHEHDEPDIKLAKSFTEFFENIQIEPP